MQPKTSVRQPVIAGARRQHLSELLRQWRRQPRKRSPLLFWTLLSLALMSDSGLLFLTARFLGVWDFLSPAEGRIEIPTSADGTLGGRLTWESWLFDLTPARLAFYSSLLALLLFAVAAAVRLRWPLWRRRLLLAGLLSGLGCLGGSAAFLSQAISPGMPPISDSSQGMLWSASVIMGLAIILALLFHDAFVAFVGALASSIGFLAANHWPLAFAEPWPALPYGATDDICLRVQVLMLLSAYAALALAWSIAAFTLARILLDTPSNERLRRLATLTLWPIRLGVLLLAASALLEGWRALEQSVAWHGWNAQALGTILVLPGCAALVYAQRQGGIPPFRLLAHVVLVFTFLAMTWHAVSLWGNGDLHLVSPLAFDVSFFAVGLLSLSLASHAALRYYFGKQRILEV